MSDFIIDFQITGLCNLNCNFCCGAPKHKKGSSLDEIKNVVDKLKNAGVNTIVLTGGEPLLYPYVVDVIKYIYQSDIDVYLSTNGYLLPDYIEKIYRYVKCIGLPIDGSTDRMNMLMSRGEKQLTTTLNAIKLIRSFDNNITVKIGTVVSKINKNDISAIANVLFDEKNNVHPNVWRLYQFTPLRLGEHSKENHEISDLEFEKVCSNVIKSYPNQNISTLSNAQSNDAYVFIEPDLKFITLTGDEYIEIGDAKEMSVQQIIELKNNYINIVENCSKNRVWLKKQ